MKISRIKEIKNIGTFLGMGASRFQFEKLTFIYGYNTFGKTTLTDIFQSLKDNDSNIIKSRLTIPNNSGEQKVIFSVKEHNTTSEKDLNYKSNKWDSNTISPFIEIFGTEFIHKNLFTGFSIERENKENFTQFILGAEGGVLVNKIADKNKDLRAKNADLKNKIPALVKNKKDDEINNFVNFSIQGLDKASIEFELSEKIIAKQVEETRLAEPLKIINLSSPNNYSTPVNNLLNNFDKVNNYLGKDYKNIKENLLERINNHISNNFKDENGVESWIKQGLDNCKDKINGDCVFCGQNLENAQDLITAYDSYFDEEYNDFTVDIEENLNLIVGDIDNENFNQKSKLQSILGEAFKFRGLINDIVFEEKFIEFENKINSLDENGLIANKILILRTIKSNVEDKIKKPYKKINSIDFENFTSILEEYTNIIKDSKEIIDILNSKIEQFKDLYRDTEKISQNITLLKSQIYDLEYYKSRIEQDEECKKYVEFKNEINDLSKEVDNDELELAINQSEYLDDYFNKINELFIKFGSRNFNLEREDSTKGHMPVYSLKVKFHDKEITSEELKSVFSESDRRALALAIFWAKIELKTDSEKEKTIVILDDPITSFDENRVLNSINSFKESLNKLSQLIILTHYTSFIKSFCERSNDDNVKFLRIKKGSQTSSLEDLNINEFTDTQYEKIVSRIYGFIDREHNNCIKTDLRPFLENLYFPTLFAKELKVAEKNSIDISSLSLKINVVFEHNETVKNKFHSFRENLNPDSHIFTSNNEEDVRNFASEMMDYLYSFRF